MDRKIYENYVRILENELVPALGCTEPIALAYASAKARETLGEFPEHLSVLCSGNIIAFCGRPPDGKAGCHKSNNQH